MVFTLKINSRNDLHLPADILRHLNLGKEKILKVDLRKNGLVLIPVDLEPRYSQEELEGLDRIHEDEKKKGWVHLKSNKDIENLLK